MVHEEVHCSFVWHSSLGGRAMGETAVSVEKGSMPESVFEPPAEYQKPVSSGPVT
jgi:hypothetical protein